MSDQLDVSRRVFLTGGGLAVAAAAQGTGPRIVAILADPSDAVAAAPIAQLIVANPAHAFARRSISANGKEIICQTGIFFGASPFINHTGPKTLST